MSFQDPRTERLQQLYMRLLGDVSGPGGAQQDAWQNSLYEQDMRARMAPSRFNAPGQPIPEIVAMFQGQRFPTELNSGPAAGAANEGVALSPQALAEKGMTPTPKKTGAKKKGKRSEFFALLRKMDAEEAEGKTDTRKAMKALLKQMNAEGSVSPT